MTAPPQQLFGGRAEQLQADDADTQRFALALQHRGNVPGARGANRTDWFQFAELSDSDDETDAAHFAPGRQGFQDEQDTAAVLRRRQQASRAGTDVRVRGPRIRDVEQRDDDQRIFRRERRRARRRGEGRTLAPVDQLGVRGEQLAPHMSRADEYDFRKNEPGMLDLFFNQNGRPKADAAAGVPLSTSWVRNVRFDAELISNGPSLKLKGVRPDRLVTDGRAPVVEQLNDSGAIGVGGEYAVFRYRLKSRDPVFSSDPAERFNIMLKASYLDVQKTVLADIFFVDMRFVDPVLRAPGFTPVQLRNQAMTITKQRDTRGAGVHTATVRRPYVQYTLRRDPERNRWLLTEIEFWLMRHFLYGADDASRFLYWRVEWLTNGRPEPEDRFVVDAVEDAASNALDPLLWLNVSPSQQKGRGAFELVDDETYELRVRVTTEQPVMRLDALGADALDQSQQAQQFVRSVRYFDVPEASVLVRTSNLLLRSDAQQVQLPQRKNSAPSVWTIADSTAFIGTKQLFNVRLGPVRMSQVYAAIRAGRVPST